jgi:hypothetical protein
MRVIVTLVLNTGVACYLRNPVDERELTHHLGGIESRDQVMSPVGPKRTAIATAAL